jgi:pimeloyl-ACP methyl ester carboxylesterase
MEQLEIDGLRIAYQRQGDGPPLLLLHGFVGDSREWAPEIDGLSDLFTVVAWDAPGAGSSADPPESFRMPDFADCLAGFVEALHLGPTHVIGLSFGGALALELFRRHPAIPATLVLASTYAGWTGSLSVDVAQQRLELTLPMADLPPDDFVQGLIPTMLSESAAPERVDALAAIMSQFHPAGFRTMARALAEADLRDVLPRIDVPTLLLHADQDARAPLTVARALHAAIRGSSLVVMAGVGHMSNVEGPDRFVAEVRKFLVGRALSRS